MDNVDISKLDLKALNKLTPAEKELAFSILKELSKEGKSDIYNQLLLEDYAEIPTDIETFVDDNYYLGNAWHDAAGNSKLYPYWRKELKKLFPNNFETNVNNVILSGSRGRGKALPNSSYVKTINGKKQVKDITTDDYLIDRENNPTKVLGVFPQGQKYVYEIIFEDERTANCCIDHLWTYTTDEKTLQTAPLKELIYLNLTKDIYIPLNIEDEKKYNKKYLKIKTIIKLDYKEEMTCFYVDNKEHLFQLHNGIVTHNTEIAVLIAAYLLHRILCLKNPIEHFHLKSTEKIVFAFVNIKLALAEEIATTKFQNTIKLSPWFLAHGTLEGRTKKVWVPQKYINENGEEQEAIDIKIGSQSDDLIGLPIYYMFADEISFIRNQDIEKQKEKANDILDTAIGGMKTRFVHNGKNPTLLCLASSKRSDKSFLEEHMKKKLESEKENVYISDGSVWEVKPEGTYSSETFKVALGNKFLQSMIVPEGEDEKLYISRGYKIIDVPIDFKADFIDDIDRALCDFAGISSSSITKYINGALLYDLINPNMSNPFENEILEIGNGPDDDRQYYNFFNLGKIDPALKNKPLFIHLDMSVSGDKTGIAGVFIKGKKTSIDELNQSNDLFFSLAFSVSIKAPKGRQISFEKNRNFIYWLKAQGFNIKGITTDSFQSCLPGDAEIKTPLGFIKIKDVAPGEVVLTYNIEKDIIEPETVTFSGETNQTDELYEIKMQNNETIICTGNHLILTKNGYVRADSLNEGDEIICSVS